MLKGKTPNLSFLAITFISFSSCLTLFILENSKVEAALNADEVLTAGDRVPVDNTTIKRSIEMRKPQGWEKRLLGGNIFSKPFPKEPISIAKWLSASPEITRKTARY